LGLFFFACVSFTASLTTRLPFGPRAGAGGFLEVFGPRAGAGGFLEVFGPRAGARDFFVGACCARKLFHLNLLRICEHLTTIATIF
jgi:hypothetical protein